VRGQRVQDGPELGDPLRPVVGDEQVHAAAVLARRDVERYDEVAHGVEEVGAAAAGGEDHRRRAVVRGRAPGRDHVEAERCGRHGPRRGGDGGRVASASARAS
jgi:hypothetical protein